MKNVYIGKNGAIRAGDCVSKSFDIAGVAWVGILVWEKATGKGDVA